MRTIDINVLEPAPVSAGLPAAAAAPLIVAALILGLAALALLLLLAWGALLGRAGEVTVRGD